MTISTVATWHELVRSRDTNSLNSLLADDVVFHSPVVHTPQVDSPLEQDRELVHGTPPSQAVVASDNPSAEISSIMPLSSVENEGQSQYKSDSTLNPALDGGDISNEKSDTEN